MKSILRSLYSLALIFISSPLQLLVWLMPLSITNGETAEIPSASCVDNPQIENALSCVQYTYASQNKCNWTNWSQMADECKLFDAAIDDFLLQLVLQDKCKPQTYLEDIRLPVYVKYNICHQLLSSPSSAPSTQPSAPPTVLKECSLEEVDLVEVFADYRKLLLGLFLAAIVTAPAVSVYLRNTAERPKKSYLYSCIVKFVSAFFTVSVLAGGIYEIFMEDCTRLKTVNNLGMFPFLAAFVTESIEFIFDVGRLVILFGDPGTIDYYQNARWNSNVQAGGTIQSTIRCCAVGLSSLPIAFLMFVMWNFNLVSQLLSWYFDENEDGTIGIAQTAANSGFWLSVFFLYITLSFSCVGGYYLLRMTCPCCYGFANIGENQGIGFYWAQFKLIAIDVPGLISSIVVNPSSLVFFWTAEFCNDTFPMVAEFIVEKFFEEDEEEEEEEEVDFDGEVDEKDNHHDEKDKFVREYNLEGDSAYKNLFLPIVVSNRRCCRQISHEIVTEFPLQLKGHLDETTWQDFCHEINVTLESIVPLKQRKPDRCIKIVCIGIGIIMTFIYWGITFGFRPNKPKNEEEVFPLVDDAAIADDDEKYESNAPLQEGPLYAILIICCFMMVLICVKLCFVRDLESESEILLRLEQVCEDYSRESEIYFHLKTNNSVWIWMRQGGLSCMEGVESIKSIECNFYVGTTRSARSKIVLEE